MSIIPTPAPLVKRRRAKARLTPCAADYGECGVCRRRLFGTMLVTEDDGRSRLLRCRDERACAGRLADDQAFLAGQPLPPLPDAETPF